MNSKDEKKYWPDLGPEADKMLKLVYTNMDIVVLYKRFDTDQEERYRNEAIRILRYTFRRFDKDNPEKMRKLIYKPLWKWAVSYAYEDPDYVQVYYDESVKYDEDGWVPVGAVNPSDLPKIDGVQAIICKEQIEKFTKFLSMFDKDARMILLNRLMGWTYEEIGEMVQVSTGTARKGVRKLFNEMIDHFIHVDEITKAKQASEAM